MTWGFSVVLPRTDSSVTPPSSGLDDAAFKGNRRSNRFARFHRPGMAIRQATHDFNRRF